MSARSAWAGWVVAAMAIAAAVGFIGWRTPTAMIPPAPGEASVPVAGVVESDGTPSLPAQEPVQQPPLPAAASPESTPRALVRFDPSGWPPLPDESAPIADHLDTLKARAQQGDHGAACWVGLALSACRQAAVTDRARTAWHQRWLSRRDEGSEPKRLELLSHEDARLSLLQRCTGVPATSASDILPMLHQAALGGSKVAIARLVMMDPFSLVGGFPDGVQYRRVLEDVDRLWWAGLQGGVPQALEATVYRFPQSLAGRTLSAGGQPRSPRQLGALAYLTRGLLVRQGHRHAPGMPLADFIPDAASDIDQLQEPDPTTKLRLDALAEAWDQRGWAEDLGWYQDSGDGGAVHLARACGAFTDPVARAADPWQVLAP